MAKKNDNIIFNQIQINGEITPAWAEQMAKMIARQCSLPNEVFAVEPPRSRHAEGTAVDVTRHGVVEIGNAVSTSGAPIRAGDLVTAGAGGNLNGESTNPGIIGTAISEADENGNVLVSLQGGMQGWAGGDTIVDPNGNAISFYDSTGMDDEEGYHEIRDEILAAMLLFMYLELKKPPEERSQWSQFDKRIKKIDTEKDWSHVKCEFTITMDDLRHAQQELGTMRQVIDLAKSMMSKPSGKKLRRLVKI